MPPKTKKGEKITDPKRLETLAKARAKAVETNKRKAEERKKIKMAKEMKRKQELEEADAILGKARGSVPSDPPDLEIKKEVKPEEHKEGSKGTCPLDSESDTPEIEYRKKPKAKKKKIVYVDESESEEEIEYVKRRKEPKQSEPAQTYQPPPMTPQEQQKVARENYLANLMAKHKSSLNNFG